MVRKQLRSLIAPFPELKIKGARATKITGICSHSKQVAPGNLFVARRGASHDGSTYIPDALKAGATAIVTDLYDPSLPVPQIIGQNLAQIEGMLADAFYGNPSQKLATIGVTGTSGKTSTTFLIRHLLEGAGLPCGLVGSVEARIGAQSFVTRTSLPEPSTTHYLLWEMVQRGCKAAVLEVNSHGLVQERVRGVSFDTALFTNLSHDHLDYHKNMKAYAEAKAKLFQGVPKAALNGDDPWHKQMGVTGGALLFGLQRGCDLTATDILITPSETHFTAHYQGQQAKISLPLIGQFNVYNALAALAACLLQQIPLAKLAPLFATFPGVPGRLERVPNKRSLTLYVDFAHKPDALKNVLDTLRALQPKRLITVVGCGGDRDREKRPVMGKIASELSDVAIFTSDNPRSEDPLSICQQMAYGVDNCEIVVDRRCAIAHAIEMATPDDLILIAGRGHEQTQILASGVVPFDDRTVARELTQ